MDLLVEQSIGQIEQALLDALTLGLKVRLPPVADVPALRAMPTVGASGGTARSDSDLVFVGANAVVYRWVHSFAAADDCVEIGAGRLEEADELERIFVMSLAIEVRGSIHNADAPAELVPVTGVNVQKAIASVGDRASFDTGNYVAGGLDVSAALAPATPATARAGARQSEAALAPLPVAVGGTSDALYKATVDQLVKAGASLALAQETAAAILRDQRAPVQITVINATGGSIEAQARGEQ
jgi:hypothetical protein